MKYSDDDELKQRSQQEPEETRDDDLSQARQVQQEQSETCPKQAKLLAALSQTSRKMLEDVKKGMLRFGQKTAQEKARAAADRGRGGQGLSESFAERGEMQRQQANIRTAVVDHDALTVAEGGQAAVPGAVMGDEGVKSIKRRRAARGRKGRSR